MRGMLLASYHSILLAATVYAFTESQHTVYIAMELCKGNLNILRPKILALPVSTWHLALAPVMKDVLLGVEYMHSKVRQCRCRIWH